MEWLGWVTCAIVGKITRIFYLDAGLDQKRDRGEICREQE